MGSHSYGTNIESSDVDYKGIFIQNPKDVYLYGYKELLIINKDETYYELGRFLKLCSTGDPIALEVLFAPQDCIEYMNPVYNDILSIKEMFLTKNLRHSFANYALKQIKKADGLDKKMNWEKEKIERKSVEDMCSVYLFEDSLSSKSLWQLYLTRLKELWNDERTFNSSAIKLVDWLNNRKYGKRSLENCGLVKLDKFRDCYLFFYKPDAKPSYRGITSGSNANDVILSVIEKGDVPIGILFFNKDAYSVSCKKWNEYEKWLENRNTARYVEVEGHGQQIDGKNILHCVRIIETAMEIPVDKTINIKRKNAEFLIEIRKGKHNLETLLNKCEEDIKLINDTFINSDLPDKFEKGDFINHLVLSIKNQFFHQYYMEQMLGEEVIKPIVEKEEIIQTEEEIETNKFYDEL